VSGRAAIALVARRELTQRVRERSFQISTGITLAIIALVVVLPGLLGFGGRQSFAVAVADPAAAPLAAAAAQGARAFDAEVERSRVAPGDARQALQDGDVDVVLDGRRILSKEKPDDTLVELLQAANRRLTTARALKQAGLGDAQQRLALDPPLLAVETTESVGEDDDEKAGFVFIAILVLYGQLLTYGFWVASGVVEEKASRVVEVLLATIRPRDLLAGKVLGLGLLGFVQMLLIAGVGLALAAASGTLEVTGDVVYAALLALAWFVLGYAFYAGAFAVAGALVPRQEELQASTAPLTLLILVSFFLAFAVADAPSSTLAHVTAFLPFAAPMTMPPRIALGEVGAGEVLASVAVTLAATAALVPLAARIYANAVLRTGSAVKLREALRS